MLDIDDHGCKKCGKRIPVNREFCYICDLTANNKPVKTPQTIGQLCDEFINEVDLKDYEPEDVLALFDKFEKFVYTKKYRISIQ